MAAKIHKSSIVNPKADIAENVEIGPFCTVGEGAIIHKNVRLVSHVVIESGTEIGEGCTIFPFTSIGTAPQDLKYKKEKTRVVIGKNNIIRENITINRASVSGTGVTELGDSNFLMAYVHIAHDCKVGNSIIMANAATLAGHVVVEDFAVIGGMVAVHQFTAIGAYAMVGGFSGISQDIAPYTMASGSRAKLYGLNLIGLKRHGFSEESMNDIKKAYKIVFREKRTLKEAIKKIRTELSETDATRHFLEFIEKNTRGLCRP